jgi:hypothetical protein
MATQAVQRRLGDLTIYDVKLIWRNFSGEEKQFNPKGQRNFSILIGPDDAQAMLADGWNIKFMKPQEGDDPNEPLQAHLPVKVNFNGRPPKIVMVTRKGKTALDEDLVGALDYVVIAKADIIINPYRWNVSGKSGITAYCKSLYITIQEDELDLAYADIPELDRNGNLLALESGEQVVEFEDLGENYNRQYELEA